MTEWQELKETIIELRDNDGTASQQEVCKFLVNYMEVLEKQMQEPWIPVSERLPETSGRYLAYIVNKHDDKLKYIMTCEYVVDRHRYWFPDDECASDNVIAWMPLPEPYKSQESED